MMRVKRMFFVAVHQLASRFKSKRLIMWAYLKWFNLYVNTKTDGYFEFVRDYFEVTKRIVV